MSETWTYNLLDPVDHVSVSTDTVTCGTVDLSQISTNTIYSTNPFGTNTFGTFITNGTGTSPYTIGISDTTSIFQSPDAAMNVQGDLECAGDIKIQGVSIKKTLENIEKRLNILNTNPELEESWAELKELGDSYRKLEESILEKQKIYNILRK